MDNDFENTKKVVGATIGTIGLDAGATLSSATAESDLGAAGARRRS